MNFATLKGLTIPEGVVTQIADASGRVLWSAVRMVEDRAVLTVAKQTATTYAGETQYANESFILLDIYPQRGGTVNVTYGGLTKTIMDDGSSENPNAQKVFFGTFNGVSDSVTTSNSGTLTIEGNFTAYGCGSYGSYSGKSNNAHCPCITGVSVFGEHVTEIPNYAFYKSTALALTELPSGITSIGNDAFYNCTALALTELPSGITSIGNDAFYNCTALALTELPSGITSIGDDAFHSCSGISITNIPLSLVKIGRGAFRQCSKIEYFHVETGNANYTGVDGVLFNKDGSTLLQYPLGKSATEYSVPTGTKIIARGAFDFKSEYTAKLNNIFIPEGVTTIEDGAAYNGILTSLTIPSTVIEIGTNAFALNKTLTSVTMLCTVPPSVGVAPFPTSNCTIIVPAGCGEAYKAADGWSTYYADMIVEAS